MARFHKLSKRDIVLLTGIAAAVFVWMMIDQFFLPEVFQRKIAFTAVCLIFFYAVFLIISPEKPLDLANTIAIIIIPLFIIISVVMHVLIAHDFNIGIVISWLLTLIFIYLAYFVYAISQKIRNK